MTTDIGELVIRLRADAAQLQKAMSDAKGTVESGSSSMKKSLESLKDQFAELLPALTVAAVVEFGRRAFESADHINDLAQRIGFAGSTLSALNIPLKQSGSNLDEFSASVNRMNAMIGEAAKGTNQEAVKAFDVLGLSVRKLQQMNPEQQFYAIAKALGEQDTQAQMTERGMNIFGRSFSALIPLIKEAKGNLQSFTEQMKENGDALTDEQLKRIDEMGDRWVAALEKMKMHLLDVVPLLEQVAQVPDYVRAIFIDLPQQAGHGLVNYARTGHVAEEYGPFLKGTVSTERPETVSEAKVLEELSGPLEEAHPKDTTDARGSNADLLREKTSTLTEYIKNLRLETSAIGESDRALAIQKAEIEGAARAKDDYNNHLRTSKDLLPQEKLEIDQLAGSYYDLKKAQEENARVAQMMKDALSDSLAEIAVNFESLRDTATGAIQAIAKEIIKAKITTPLANSIIDALPSFSGFGKMLGFADGGSPPVGVPSIVGENGPEIFVPNTAGTVIPNHALGGTTVVVQQTFNMQPGLPETVGAAIRQAAPAIASAAHASVFRALQNGGSESRIAGLRN